MSQVISARRLVFIALVAVLLCGVVGSPSSQLLADDPVVTGGDVG